MTRALPLLAACFLLIAACGPAAEERPPAGLLSALASAEPMATPSAVETDTAAPTLPAATPTRTLVSEVLPAFEPPQAPSILGGTALPLPEGTAVVWGGCASDGRCYPYNFYWAPTHEVVMQAGESAYKVQHELCHAHQHWTVNRGDRLPPSDYDLESWYGTPEGNSFASAVESLPWPWSHSAVSALEDFAWTCASWYLDPAHLLAVSPERFEWAAGNLP